jgi:hypothetical protein
LFDVEIISDKMIFVKIFEAIVAIIGGGAQPEYKIEFLRF